MFFDFIVELLLDGLRFLRDYALYPAGTFSLMRIVSLFIAFSISGAMVVFLSQNAVLKNLGPNAKRLQAYSVASVSGMILAVCSCSVLPMFASIRKKGAGLGPAIAFLFSGPAINVLAITLTFTDLGPDIAFARIIGAIILASLIGFTVFFVFKKQETSQDSGNFALDETESGLNKWQTALFFATLFAMLIFGVYRPLPTLIFAGLLLLQIIVYFKKEPLLAWGRETFDLAKKILPLFLAGVFFAGILSSLLSEDALTRFVGSNTLNANFIASILGAFMYFATLTEVPIVSTLLNTGMHRGPAVALLLAGPSLSIPNMIVIAKVIGVKRTSLYIALVVIFSTFAGLIAGFVFGWFG